MPQIDKFIPVYASPKDKQIKFYFVTTTSDCPICMSFHTLPQITNCGHIFCKDCLAANQIHFGLCPICYYYICDTFEVKWLFTNEVKKNDWCTFIKVNYKDGDNLKNFWSNPFSRKYFLEGEGCFSDEFFYQIIDGGYYFLEGEAIRKGKKWRCMPDIIVGKVYSLRRMVVSKENHFGLKPYIGLSVYFVKLEE